MSHDQASRSPAKPVPSRWLQPGGYIGRGGQVYRIVAPPDPAQRSLLLVHVEDEATAERRTFTVAELLGTADRERAAPVFAATRERLREQLERTAAPPETSHDAGLPPECLARADHMLATVRSIDAIREELGRQCRLRGEKRRTADLLRDAVAAHNRDAPTAKRCCLATYYNYRRACRKGGWVRERIAAAMRRSTYHQSRMSAAQLHCVDTCILHFWGRRPGITASYVHAAIGETLERTGGLWVDPDRCGERGAPADLVANLLDPRIPIAAILANPDHKPLLVRAECPSWGWFTGYLRWYLHQPGDGEQVFVERYGREAWERERRIFDTYARRAQMPLQYVFADHCLLNVFTVDDETREEVARLWLTVLLDAYSRAPIGFSLHYESPCIESIQSALRHAIWPKQPPPGVGRGREWVCYGIALQLSLDNAWAHLSGSLEDVARAIAGVGGEFDSIELAFRPPYKARYGALIERFFRTLKARLRARLAGAGAIQGEGKGDKQQVRSAAQESCLLYGDLYNIIWDELIDYMHTPHGELEGQTPHERWQHGLAYGIPKVPPLDAGMERLFLRKHHETRPITAVGICLWGMHYRSDDLAQAQRIDDSTHEAIQYGIRYDPDDIGRLALFRDGHWVCDVVANELLRADGSLRRVSHAERRLALALLPGRRKRAGAWVAQLQESDDLIKARQAERRAARRARVRAHAGGGFTDPAAPPAAVSAEGAPPAPGGDPPDDADYDRLLSGWASAHERAAAS